TTRPAATIAAFGLSPPPPRGGHVSQRPRKRKPRPEPGFPVYASVRCCLTALGRDEALMTRSRALPVDRGRRAGLRRGEGQDRSGIGTRRPGGGGDHAVRDADAGHVVGTVGREAEACS